MREIMILDITLRCTNHQTNKRQTGLEAKFVSKTCHSLQMNGSFGLPWLNQLISEALIFKNKRKEAIMIMPRFVLNSKKSVFQRRALFLATKLSKSGLAKDHGSFVTSDSWLWGPRPQMRRVYLQPTHTAELPEQPSCRILLPLSPPPSLCLLGYLSTLCPVSILSVSLVLIRCLGYSRHSVDICWKSTMDEKYLWWENCFFQD